MHGQHYATEFSGHVNQVFGISDRLEELEASFRVYSDEDTHLYEGMFLPEREDQVSVIRRFILEMAMQEPEDDGERVHERVNSFLHELAHVRAEHMIDARCELAQAHFQGKKDQIKPKAELFDLAFVLHEDIKFVLSPIFHRQVSVEDYPDTGSDAE